MKEVLYFNSNKFNSIVDRLKTELTAANRLVMLQTEILGTPRKLSLDLVKKHLQEKTGFPNIEAAAELLNLDYHYTQLVEQMPKFTMLDKLEFHDKTYHIAPNVIEELREEFTTYLSPKATKHFKKLEKAVKVLNEYPRGWIFGVLQHDVDKPYKLNKIRLEHHINEVE